MDDILEEASNLLECKQCPWYRSCVIPLRFSTEDLRREMQQMLPASLGGAEGDKIRELILNMASAVPNTLLEGCPIFINRLKSSPKLAEKLKKIMQTWGEE